MKKVKKMISRFNFRWYFEKRDAWIGVFWDKHNWGNNKGFAYKELLVYICIIPFFPMKFSFRWNRRKGCFSEL